MKLGRLRSGELIALAGAICLVLSLFLPSYQTATGKLDAWRTLGGAVVMLMVAAAAATVMVVSAAAERGTALPVSASVWSALFGIVAVAAALVRLMERPHHATAVCAGPWLALVGSVVILLGSWQAMRDERTSLYEPAEPDPRIPPRA